MGKILVTGGAGYIGGHTLHYLLEKGIKKKNIIVFDNLSTGHEENIPKGLQFYKGDLLNKNDIESCFKENNISTVIHFAAYSIVGESMQNPGKYFENNIIGGINLLEQMNKSCTKNIVFSSSAAIFGNPIEIPIRETHTTNPINIYGETKLIFEKILDWYDKIYGIKSVCLRYFNAAGEDYGLREKHNPETHLIPLVVKTAIGEKNSINIFGDNYPTPDGTCIRDYIHIKDLADAHYKALNYLENNGISEKFNLGTGEGTSVLEIINLVKNISGKNFKVEINERRNGDPSILIADSEKIRTILEWKKKYGIEDIINSVLC